MGGGYGEIEEGIGLRQEEALRGMCQTGGYGHAQCPVSLFPRENIIM